jgi:hypothetical protein
MNFLFWVEGIIEAPQGENRTEVSAQHTVFLWQGRDGNNPVEEISPPRAMGHTDPHTVHTACEEQETRSGSRMEFRIWVLESGL